MGWKPGMPYVSLWFFPSPDPKPAEASDFRNKEDKEGRKVTAWWFRKGLLSANLEA